MTLPAAGTLLERAATDSVTPLDGLLNLETGGGRSRPPLLSSAVRRNLIGSVPIPARKVPPMATSRSTAPVHWAAGSS
jgi:hypothetical protein